MPDLRAELAALLREKLLACRCGPAWTELGRHASDCLDWLADEIPDIVLAHLRGVGACGEECAPLFAGGERLHCELLAGHTGWHEAGEGPLPTRWNLRPGVSDLEWRVVMPGGTTRCFSDFYSARRFASAISGARVESRAVTTYPDGSTLATPWREDSEA